jgi:uncharacterized membrane protein YfcA
MCLSNRIFHKSRSLHHINEYIYVSGNNSEGGLPMRKRGTSGNAMAYGLAIGVALGTTFGFMFDNYALGVAIGIALGAGIGASVQSKKKYN